jgi:hypothetical protein
MSTSPRHFQRDDKKYANVQDMTKRSKDMVRHEMLDDERKEMMKRWITFFRRNPHRCIEFYFGIKLYPYQIMMIWVLQRSNLAYIVASRAAAKTFIIAVWALTLAVLYPGIQIIVASKTLKQASLILSDKLKWLKDTYPVVNREIRTITTNSNGSYAEFYCGSSIKAVVASDNSRGNRCNYLILEEARMVPKEILDNVLKPFLFSRTPPYRLLAEYKDDDRLKEEGTMSFITSAWYKSEYWFDMVKTCILRMIDGDTTAGFLCFDYLITLYHNIKTEEMLKNEMADMDALSIQMEYLNIPSGNSGKSYFKLSLFNRNAKKAFYPQKENTYSNKKNPYELKKLDSEVRIVSVDVATRANKANDNSIIGCIRLIPLMGKGYDRTLVYMESHKGENTITQAKRIKEVFYDFDANYIVLDLQNSGISIFDALSQVTKNEERNIDYNPMTVAEFNFIDDKLKEELMKRTLGINAEPVIYPVLATQNLNSQIAVAFRTSLQKKLWNFLINESDAEEFLIRTNKEFTEDVNDSSSFGFFMNAYVQTSLFVGECINLDMSLVNGLIKLIEKSGSYKDRYSCISYANWLINYLDQDLLKEDDGGDDLSAILAMTQWT